MPVIFDMRLCNKIESTLEPAHVFTNLINISQDMSIGILKIVPKIAWNVLLPEKWEISKRKDK